MGPPDDEQLSCWRRVCRSKPTSQVSARRAFSASALRLLPSSSCDWSGHQQPRSSRAQSEHCMPLDDQLRTTHKLSQVAWCENFGIDIDAQTDLKLLECSVRENRWGGEQDGVVGNDCVVTVDECEFENAVSSLRIDNKARYTSKIFLRNSSMDEDNGKRREEEEEEKEKEEKEEKEKKEEEEQEQEKKEEEKEEEEEETKQETENKNKL
eukprot:765217-Hanusia_phi.AAC.3